jgi:transcription antitermination factor NusG
MPFREHARVTDAAGARPRLPSGTRPLIRECGPQWFALRLRSNREFAVRAALEGLSIETFLPTWWETVEWSDRVKRVERLFFPGYVFARMADGPEFYRALTVRGVVQMLPNSYNPAPIADIEIDAVKRVVVSKLHAVACEYSAGDAVVIDSGPLAGIAGVVVRTRGSVHVVVSIELLRRSVRVEIDADTLLRAGVAA